MGKKIRLGSFNTPEEAFTRYKEYDFNSILKQYDYMALHDDPEIWVDAIYEWSNEEVSLLEM